MLSGTAHTFRRYGVRAMRSGLVSHRDHLIPPEGICNYVGREEQTDMVHLVEVAPIIVYSFIFF